MACDFTASAVALLFKLHKLLLAVEVAIVCHISIDRRLFPVVSDRENLLHMPIEHKQIEAHFRLGTMVLGGLGVVCDRRPIRNGFRRPPHRHVYMGNVPKQARVKTFRCQNDAGSLNGKSQQLRIEYAQRPVSSVVKAKILVLIRNLACVHIWAAQPAGFFSVQIWANPDFKIGISRAIALLIGLEPVPPRQTPIICAEYSDCVSIVAKVSKASRLPGISHYCLSRRHRKHCQNEENDNDHQQLQQREAYVALGEESLGTRVKAERRSR